MSGVVHESFCDECREYAVEDECAVCLACEAWICNRCSDSVFIFNDPTGTSSTPGRSRCSFCSRRPCERKSIKHDALLQHLLTMTGMTFGVAAGRLIASCVVPAFVYGEHDDEDYMHWMTQDARAEASEDVEEEEDESSEFEEEEEESDDSSDSHDTEAEEAAPVLGKRPCGASTQSPKVSSPTND